MEAKTVREEPETLVVRIPASMMRMLEEEVVRDTHLNISELVRESIRQELRRRGRQV